jgi:hypothetical protein
VNATGYGREVEVAVVGLDLSKLLTLFMTDATRVPVFGTVELKLNTSKAFTACASELLVVLLIYPL